MSNPNIFVLYSNVSADTGKKIAQIAGWKCGSSYPTEREPVDLIINYGSSLAMPEYLNSIPVFNPVESVAKNSSNKGETLRRLNNAGVSTAQLFDITDLLSNPSKHLPLLARKSSHHSGTGTAICITEQDVKTALKDHSHFMELLSIDTEFRVHILDSMPFLIQRKDSSFVKSGISKYIRTNSNGWSFTNMGRYVGNVPLACIHEAAKAVSALNLVFGAVDIGLNSDNKPFVFEVNTGAGLTGGDNATRFINVLKVFIQNEYSL